MVYRIWPHLLPQPFLSTSTPANLPFLPQLEPPRPAHCCSDAGQTSPAGHLSFLGQMYSPASYLYYQLPHFLLTFVYTSPSQWSPSQPTWIKLESYPHPQLCLAFLLIFPYIIMCSPDPWWMGKTTKGTVENGLEETVLSMKTSWTKEQGIKVWGCPGASIKGQLCTLKFYVTRMHAAHGQGFASCAWGGHALAASKPEHQRQPANIKRAPRKAK